MNLASLLNADSYQGMASAGVELNGELSQSWYQFPPAEESSLTTFTQASSPSYIPVHHDHRSFLRAPLDVTSASGSSFNFTNDTPIFNGMGHPTSGPTSELRPSPNDSASDEELVEEDAPPRKRRRQGLSCLGEWSSCRFVVLNLTCDAQSLATRHRTS